jgi:multidrug resistance efflux pump
MSTLFSSEKSGLSNLFSRRAIFGVLLGGAGAVPLARAITPNDGAAQAPPIDILSPKDCYVLSVGAKNGDTVAAGDQLCQLDTDAEDRSLAKLAAAKALLDLEQLNLGPEVILKQRRTLEIAASVAQTYLQLAYAKDFETKRFIADTSAASAMGGGTNNVAAQNAQLLGTAHQSSAAITKALAEVEKADLALQNFAFSVGQSKDKYTLISGQLPAEEKRVMADKLRLTVLSPISGKLSLNVAVGCFVSKGTVIASVRP